MARQNVKRDAAEGRGSAVAPGSDLSDELRSTAAKLFYKRGFADTTTREITEACGVSPAAIYVHYKSKMELLYNIILQINNKFEAVWLKAMSEAGRAATDQLRALIETHAWFQAAYPEETVVANRDFANLEAPFLSRIIESRRRIQKLFEDVVQRGLMNGEFISPKEGDQRAAHHLSVALLNLSMSISQWYKSTGDWNPRQIGEFYGQLALRIVQAKR